MKGKLIKLLQSLSEIIKTGTLSQEDVAKLIGAKTKLERALETFESVEKIQLGILIAEVVKLVLEYLKGK